MTKARCLSLIHSFILAAMVAMFFSCAYSTILTCVFIGIEGLQNYSIIAKGIQLIQNSEYLKLLLSDLLLNKPFSILFTAVFATASAYMLKYHIRLFLRSSVASWYIVIIYFILFSFYFLLNYLLPISKITIFLITLEFILVFCCMHSTKNDPLWTGMDNPPKYHVCSAMSLTILIIAALCYNWLIIVITNYITKLLTYLFNMLVFPYIIVFLFLRIVNLIELICIIIGWQILGEMHDRIIVRSKLK